MNLIKRLRRSASSRTAATSYLAFISTALWGLLSIPIAVAFLEPAELGLWTIVNVFLGYLVWMDLGVGSATGRLMAEAVATRNQDEINRWWTATRAVLYAQGLVIIIIGILCIPLIIGFLGVPDTMLSEARWLLLGGIILTGLSLPMRGATGLLTAQNRFYWVPLLQIIIPWINLLVFYLLLRAGMALKAYIFALAASQAATWICYYMLIRFGPDRPRFDRSGMEGKRFTRLLKFSSGLTVTGLSAAITNSLPAMVIARMGGLGMVPVFNFSWKGPLLMTDLVQRSYQSFYPTMQRTYVSGKRELFFQRHSDVGMLTLGLALCAAGAALAFNNMVVQLLAGSAFYSGPYVNIGFALTMIVIPISGLFRILIPISGNLGKSPIISVLQIPFFIILSVSLWNASGLIGVALALALTKSWNGIYAFIRSPANFGRKGRPISKNVAWASLAAMALVITCGFAGAQIPYVPGFAVSIPGRELLLPSLSVTFVNLIPSIFGAALTIYSAKKLYISIR